MTIILLWLAAALLAYTIKGFSGFGPALIVLPTLSVLYDARLALAASSIIDVAVGLVLFAIWRFQAEERRLLLTICGYVAVGTLAGSLLAGVVPEDALLLLIGVFVVVLAVRLGLRGTTALPTGTVRNSLPVAGVLAGLSGGLVGISGPFLVAGTAHFDKTSMRRVLVGVFLVEGLVKTVVYSLNDVLTPRAFAVSAIAAPTVVAGLILGSWLHHKVSQAAFLRLLALILLVAGLQPLIQLAI